MRLVRFLNGKSVRAWWRRLRRNYQRHCPCGNAKLIRDIYQRHLGNEVALTIPVINGRGAVRLEDRLWRVTSDEDIPVQWTTVRIVGSRRNALYVVPVKGDEWEPER